MIKVMLEAVSEMLKPISKGEGGSHVLPEFETRIACAKTILDKVIEGLPIAEVTAEIVEPQPPEPPKPPKIPVGQYKIVKDANDKIVRIDGLPLDGKVELDGIIMTHKEAKGKTFSRGRIL